NSAEATVNIHAAGVAVDQPRRVVDAAAGEELDADPASRTDPLDRAGIDDGAAGSPDPNAAVALDQRVIGDAAAQVEIYAEAVMPVRIDDTGIDDGAGTTLDEDAIAEAP